MGVRVPTADDRRASSAQSGGARLGAGLLVKQILQYAPGAVLPAVMGLLMATVFTRVFRAEEYGNYSLILGVTNLISALASQWLQQGINRYLPGQADPAAVRALKAAVGLSLIALSCILSVVLGAGILLGSTHVATYWRGALWAAAALVIVSAVYNPLVVVFQAEMRASRFSIYSSASATLRFLLALLLVFMIKRNPVSLVWAGAVAIGVLVPFVWYEARLPGMAYMLRRWRRILAQVWQIARFGVPMVGWYLAAMLLDVSDRYVLQWLRGSAEVGIYAANYGLVTGAVALVASPIILAAHPFLMRAWNQGRLTEAGKWLGTIVMAFTVAGSWVVGAMWVFAEDVARWLLGPEFREGYQIMPIVLAGVMVWQLGMYTHKPLEFTGRTKLMFFLSIGSAAANLTLNMLFVPRFGYVAAAYSTVASYVLYLALTAWLGRKVLPWQLKWRYLATSEVIVLVTVLTVSKLRPTAEGLLGYWGSVGLSAVVLAIAGAVMLGPMFRRLMRGTVA